MNIRIAKLKDSKEILTLLMNAPELQESEKGDTIYSEKLIIECIKDKKMNLILVAEEDNKLIGVLLAEIWDKKKYSFGINFVVSPKYRSKGVGTKLYQMYENYCKKQNLKTILCLVQTKNKNMQQICKKKGYKKGHAFYLYEKEI